MHASDWTISKTKSTQAFAAGADIKEMASKSFVEAFSTNMFHQVRPSVHASPALNRPSLMISTSDPPPCLQWAHLASVSKPIVAAVNGYALGGGCELMMMTDVIIAGDNAKFGQPEITLGVIPGGTFISRCRGPIQRRTTNIHTATNPQNYTGCGGTQRLIRAIGKAKAMDMVLTGSMIDAAQAERDGLVSRVVPADTTVQVALEVANKIAGFSQVGFGGW